MLKSLLIANTLLTTVTPIEPNTTGIRWNNSYDLGDMEDDSFSFTYQNKDYEGNWLNTSAIQEKSKNGLGNGQYTITTNFEYDNYNNLIFNQNYPYIPCYVGYVANNIEYTEFYLIDNSTNTFVIDTTEHYQDNNTYFVFKFPYELTINHTFIYDNAITFYNDICINTNIYTNDSYLNGYNTGYDEGYKQGKQEENWELTDYYSLGGQGYENIYNIGYNDGNEDGYNLGVASDTNLGKLMLIIATTPFQTFKTIWSFDILGFNIATFTLGLLTLGIVIIIWKKIR